MYKKFDLYEVDSIDTRDLIQLKFEVSLISTSMKCRTKIIGLSYERSIIISLYIYTLLFTQYAEVNITNSFMGIKQCKD